MTILRTARRAGAALGAALALAGASTAAPRAATAADGPARCAPGGGAVRVAGTLGPEDESTYRLVPFRVADGTTRVEVDYGYSGEGAGDTVLDLGLWDEDGARAVAGFRGWSGSRHGNLDRGQAPVFVQADAATRNYNAGPVRAGRWNVELGAGAVASGGAAWRVEIRCRAVDVGPRPEPDPVDPLHVARPQPGWYHGDFHMHAFHSNPNGPTQSEFVEHARAAGLDFLPITEYVIDRHWREWGATARANPDLLFWPGREVITYFGHAIVVGETPGVIEYRHGFRGANLGRIQELSLADGALFGVAHPTIFPPPFDDFCRGCYFEAGDAIDWGRVDTIEVLTGPAIVEGGVPNPFVATAIRAWEDKLAEGYEITAVSGSDDKRGPGLGSSATAVYARELSRAALKDAIRAGHAYVRTLGVHGSPSLRLTASAPDGQTGIFGDTLYADVATIEVRVRGGDGQLLRLFRDGAPAGAVPVVGDDFTHAFEVVRSGDSGPLGTFFRVETFDGRIPTTIGNPVFLATPSSG